MDVVFQEILNSYYKECLIKNLCKENLRIFFTSNSLNFYSLLFQFSFFPRNIPAIIHIRILSVSRVEYEKGAVQLSFPKKGLTN